MQRTFNGFSCPRCGNEIRTQVVEVKNMEHSDSSPIEVVDVDLTKQAYPKVNEKCSQCGNSEAYRMVSFISGEHAGVRQEREVAHFTCAKCHHSWTKD